MYFCNIMPKSKGDGIIMKGFKIKGFNRIIAFLLVIAVSAPTLSIQATGANFQDIGGHWAQRHIERLQGLDIVNNSLVSVGLFEPEINITRAETVELLVKANLPTNLLQSVLSETSGQTSFGDIDNHILNRYIALAEQLGLADGYPDGTFRPDNPITRSEFAGLVVRSQAALEAIGQAQAAAHVFPDLNETHPQYNAIRISVESGLMLGYPDGTFGVENNITRAEAYTMISRYFEILFENYNGIVGFVWSQGRPAANVPVELIDLETDTVYQTIQTNAFGQYRFSGVSVGEYMIRAADADNVATIPSVTLPLGLALLPSVLHLDGAEDYGYSIIVVSGITLPVEQTEMLIPYKADGSIAQNVTWRSSNTAVASVDESGTVTANSVGTAIITVSADGYTSASSTVTVRAKNNQGTFSNSGEFLSEFLFGDPRPDAPELAHRGPYGVGLREVVVDTVGLADERPAMRLEIWYPATIPAGMEELAWITGYAGLALDNEAGRATRSFEFPVRALRDATPDASGAGTSGYPLVLLSHGSQSAPSLYSNIAGNLASKGYVVVAIDHAGNSKTTNSVDSAMAARRADLYFVLNVIEDASATAGSFLYGLADAHNTAILGHSMGGLGALFMAGVADHDHDPRVRAIVPVAPAGAGVADDLSNITIPILLIAGTMDDTVSFALNQTQFLSITDSDAYFLVYQSGNHQIIIDAPSYFLTGLNSQAFRPWNFANAGEATGVELEMWQEWREFIFSGEPMWDEARMSNINQHFITAFLDLHMKGNEARREFLDVPYPIASVNARYEMIYNFGGLGALDSWKGFQPWTLAGLELYHNAPVNIIPAPVSVPVNHGLDMCPFT